jgi:hypothetical protein
MCWPGELSCPPWGALPALHSAVQPPGQSYIPEPQSTVSDLGSCGQACALGLSE